MKGFALPLIILLFLSSCQNNASKVLDIQTNKDIVINFFASDYFEHRVDGARTNEDCVNIIKGAEKIFPDLTVKIEDIIAENDLIAVRLTFNATHKDVFLGIEATNKNITWEAMEFFRLKDGKITETWGNWPLHDMVDLLSN
ncbi:ester cyclase [uncultured Eudoraea sp.]|uniref:ester cyclase n=1 Tax=uncultured Eudoraea sp. TaxID=1035614 RepID=UPI00261F2DC6|nr:ester cyclase [uncultured Eudoraea sp.]